MQESWQWRNWDALTCIPVQERITCMAWRERTCTGMVACGGSPFLEMTPLSKAGMHCIQLKCWELPVDNTSSLSGPLERESSWLAEYLGSGPLHLMHFLPFLGKERITSTLTMVKQSNSSDVKTGYEAHFKLWPSILLRNPVSDGACCIQAKGENLHPIRTGSQSPLLIVHLMVNWLWASGL